MVHSRTTVHDPLAVPSHIYPYTAGVVGGLLGGFAMTIPALVYGVVSGYGIWYPVNLIAAAVLTNLQRMTPQQIAQFDPLALIVGLTLHLVVSTALGLVFAIILPTLPGRPEIWALLAGAFLWFTATAAILPNLNPIMSQNLDWTSFGIANIIYSLVMGIWIGRTPKVIAEEAHHLHFYLPKF